MPEKLVFKNNKIYNSLDYQVATFKNASSGYAKTNNFELIINDKNYSASKLSGYMDSLKYKLSDGGNSHMLIFNAINNYSSLTYDGKVYHVKQNHWNGNIVITSSSYEVFSAVAKGFSRDEFEINNVSIEQKDLPFFLLTFLVNKEHFKMRS